MKFNVIVADPPWSFSDTLTMSEVKRGADANYNTLSIQDLCALPVSQLADPQGCLLALWVPSALLKEGIEVMEAWNFDLKQSFIWAKSKKDPLTKPIEDLNDTLGF